MLYTRKEEGGVTLSVLSGLRQSSGLDWMGQHGDWWQTHSPPISHGIFSHHQLRLQIVYQDEKLTLAGLSRYLVFKTLLFIFCVCRHLTASSCSFCLRFTRWLLTLISCKPESNLCFISISLCQICCWSYIRWANDSPFCVILEEEVRSKQCPDLDIHRNNPSDGAGGDYRCDSWNTLKDGNH